MIFQKSPCGETSLFFDIFLSRVYSSHSLFDVIRQETACRFRWLCNEGRQSAFISCSAQKRYIDEAGNIEYPR